jgi:SAM-dependent methyltransferase
MFSFYPQTLQKLAQQGVINNQMSVLATCAEMTDRNAFHDLGFRDVTISGIDVPETLDKFAPYKWEFQNAERLTYADSSFDIGVVHAGLHHCYSPHRALLELLRVSRKYVLVFESRDSLLMRAAERLRLTPEYELDSVIHSGTGGVDHSAIPNFIYRWREGEVRKLVSSYMPQYQPKISFFHGMELPDYRFKVLKFAKPLGRVCETLIPGQCNKFAFLIEKSQVLQPWLRQNGNGPEMDPNYPHKW